MHHGTALRIAIADDHQVFRMGLRAVFAEQVDCDIVGEADSAQAALELVIAKRPRIAILDVRMSDQSGLSIVPQLRIRSPETRVLILSMYEDTEVIRTALSNGAHGYVNKAAVPAEIVLGVRALAAGRSFLSVRFDGASGGEIPSVDGQASTADAPSRQGARPLSEREREILQLFACGLTQRQIADRLGLRLKTIETYRARLGDKFAVRSRAELVRHARDLGLVASGREEGPHVGTGPT